jgi:hypothetical protein
MIKDKKSDFALMMGLVFYTILRYIETALGINIQTKEQDTLSENTRIILDELVSKSQLKREKNGKYYLADNVKLLDFISFCMDFSYMDQENSPGDLITANVISDCLNTGNDIESIKRTIRRARKKIRDSNKAQLP